MAGARRSGWVVDLMVGGLCGLIVGGIVAVNLVIYLGVVGGYEASLGDVFEHSLPIGILVLAVLAEGPVAGVAYMRRRSRLREEQRPAHGDGDPVFGSRVEAGQALGGRIARRSGCRRSVRGDGHSQEAVGT